MPSSARVMTLTLIAAVLTVFTIVTIAANSWRWYYIVITLIVLYAAARDIWMVSRAK